MVDRSSADEFHVTGSTNGSDSSNESSTEMAEHESRADSSSEHGDYEIDEEIIKAAAALGNTTSQAGSRRSSLEFVQYKRPSQRCNRNKEFPQMFKDGDFILSLERDIADVDKVLYRFCIYVAVAWLALIIFSYWAAPKESIVWLEGTERRAILTEICVLSTAVVMRHAPLFLNTKGKFGLRIPQISGVLAAGLTVQFIALSTSMFMASFPVPVMTDPLFKSRVHLIRWCEWTPLAGFITLLVSCVDAPNLQDADFSKRWRMRFIGAGMESASTLCGFIFPFCHSKIVWYAVMVFSLLTYSSILWSYAEKAKKMKGLTKGKSVDEIEMYERARLSLRLHGLCCLTWSGIAIMYFIGSAGHLIVPESFKLLHDPAMTMLEESFMDCVSKIFYMVVIIETHYTAFDEVKRASRRLLELQNTMSSVWESSSDTIAIMVKSKSGNLTSIVSPAFFRDDMLQQEGAIQSSVLLEIDASSTTKRLSTLTNVESRLKIGDIPNVAMRLADAEFDHANLRSLFGKAMYSIDPFGVDTSYLIKSKVLALTDMLLRAWHPTDESIFDHETVSLNENSHFEIRVTKFDISSNIVLIRDVSERYKRHEAEKKGAYETTEREIDDQANRFAKHEIKNGILGAIEVCELLRGQICGDFDMLQKTKSSIRPEGSISKESIAASLGARFENVAELDTMLHEILDIILADTMSNDVIHGIYKPKICKVNVQHLLMPTNRFGNKKEQFVLETSPSSLPILLTDQGLLKCIHGNALRNALKYGKPGGTITTVAKYECGIFELKVINQPGPYHQKLVDLGDQSSDLVFSYGTRLHNSFDDKTKAESAGDGGWIMKKCAEILKGTVAIHFKAELTEFLFRAPMNTSVISDTDNLFCTPKGTWAIGIDDSKMQRKLLSRLFIHVGIPENRQIIFGRNSNEIQTFVEVAVNFIKNHPADLFLIIADENLELAGDFVSGSSCIQHIRCALAPKDEKRILALVRSANDGAADQALYNSKAHGFLPKIPLSAINAKSMISPLWTRRFPHPAQQLESEPEYTPESFRMIKRPTIENIRDHTLIRASELMAKMNRIDTIISTKDFSNSHSQWFILLGKLHQLKGDLLSANLDGRFNESIGLIDGIEGKHAPSDILSRWLQIRTKIALAT